MTTTANCYRLLILSTKSFHNYYSYIEVYVCYYFTIYITTTVLCYYLTTTTIATTVVQITPIYIIIFISIKN